MFWKAIILFYFCMGIIAPSEDHAFYMTVFDYDLDHEVLQIRVFSDDLINALHAADSTIAFNAEPCAYRAQLESYMGAHLTTKINGQVLPFQLAHCDIIGDAHLFSCTLKVDAPITEVVIESDFLIDLFPDQNNVIKINYRGERKAGRLDEDQFIFELLFE